MCAFFARPNLDNTQFKQLMGGEPLTLSGQTQIATTSGLTLYGGVSGGTVMYIPIIATGATNNYVLTYDSIKQAIVLKESTASGGTGVYTCRTPTTCTVGGLSANTNIFNCSVNYILECALVPIVNPILTNPSISAFSINCTETLLEVGSTLSVCGLVTVDLGSIDSNYAGITDTRSCGVSGYTFNYFGTPGAFTPNTSLSTLYSSGIGTINEGSNIPVTVCAYFSGGSQPYDSNGGLYSTPFVATAYTENKLITGIYPWFWGIESGGVVPAGTNRPDGTCIKNIIGSGTVCGTVCKVVETTCGTLDIPFNSSAYDYIWFALPSGTTKTKWTSLSNNGEICGSISMGGNLFPEPEVVTNVCTTCWNGQTYQIYVSNYQSAVSTIMEIN